jgi:CHAD domain-containing protein
VALHEARKADKQVRYMTELVIPVLDEPARRLHRHAEKLQKLLGENQDSVMARSTLLSLGNDAHSKGHSAFTYGLLYGVEYRRAEQALQDVPDRLAKLHDAKTVAWLPAPQHDQSEP